LSPRQQEAILDAYPNKNDLAMMIKYKLEENLDWIAGGENLTVIVFNLLTEWANPKGKLEQLFQACYQERPGNPKMKELAQQYQNHQKQERLDKLIKILKENFDKENSVILTCYESSLYQVRKLNKTKPQNVEEIIHELDMPSQDKYTYVDKFVGYLHLKNTQVSLSNNFRTWVRDNITNFNDLIEQLQEEQEKQKQQSHPCLIIAISEFGHNYVAEAWLIKNISQYNRVYCPDCEQLKIENKSVIPTDKVLSNLPLIIIDLIQQSLIKSENSINQIHIFLPPELMNHDVDSWKSEKAKEGEEDFCIGICEYSEVVIRCSDRLRGKSPPVYAWRQKASKFKDKLEQWATSVFVLGSSDNQKTLFNQVKQEEVIAVKITSVFEKREVLGKIIFKSAIPLALWTRQQIPDIEEELSSIFQNEDNDIYLKELPSQFKRKKAQGNNNIKHFCLLWDDPDLRPPEQQLTQNNL
jgi:hypothetical protein